MNIGESIHAFIFFFIIAGFFLLFLSRPKQTNALMTTIIGGVQGLSGAMTTFIGGNNPS